MDFFLLKLWDWYCKSKGIRKETEYGLPNILKVLLEWVKLSLEKSEHHTRQLAVSNPIFYDRQRRTTNRQHELCKLPNKNL
jgi:hypothetical protein